MRTAPLLGSRYLYYHLFIYYMLHSVCLLQDSNEDGTTPRITLAELRSHDTSQVSQDLSEALKREKKLKLRVQELVSTLEKLSRNSEIRHQQSAEFVNDLKRANRYVLLFFCFFYPEGNSGCLSVPP
jgi:hypothetical protein